MSHDEQDGEDKLKEPDAAYSTNRLRIFHSFEEAEVADMETTLQQAPLERIRETVQLILRVYGVTQEELNTRKRHNSITIIKP